MREAGHEVQIACDPTALLCERAKAYGFEVIQIPLSKKKFGYIPPAASVLNEFQPDIVNTHSSNDAWIFALASMLARTKPTLVRTRHVSAEVESHLLNRWLYGKAHKATATTGSLITQHLISRLRLDPSTVQTIPTGVDCDRFAPASTKQAQFFTVGIVATLRSWKGHSYLIDALPELPDHVELLVVGDGPQMESLREQVALGGLESRVSFTGHVDDPAPYFTQMDAFCLPSYANEGVPQALLQASACALPIITTDAGGIPDLIEHENNGLVVAKKSHRALAEGIERLLSAPTLARQLGHTAREVVLKKHSMAQMTEKMHALYQLAQSR